MDFNKFFFLNMKYSYLFNLKLCKKETKIKNLEKKREEMNRWMGV